MGFTAYRRVDNISPYFAQVRPSLSGQRCEAEEEIEGLQGEGQGILSPWCQEAGQGEEDEQAEQEAQEVEWGGCSRGGKSKIV